VEKILLTSKKAIMKNIFFLRFLTIFLASAIMISCSKEKFSSLKANETNSITNAKLYPVPYHGGISGTLIPAPYDATLKFYHEEGNFAAYCFADQAGHFKITTLIPGMYRIMIIYIPNTPGNYPDRDEYKYYEIRDVKVEYDVVNELGDIFIK
jgi:hypothetical protein